MKCEHVNECIFAEWSDLNGWRCGYSNVVIEQLKECRAIENGHTPEELFISNQQ